MYLQSIYSLIKNKKSTSILTQDVELSSAFFMLLRNSTDHKQDWPNGLRVENFQPQRGVLIGLPPAYLTLNRQQEQSASRKKKESACSTIKQPMKIAER